MGGIVSSIFGGGGGGGGGSAPAPAPSSQTVTNTSIPAYAQPYVETMLGQTQALTDVNQNPYQAYTGERMAQFSPLQQQAFSNVASQTTAGQLVPATGLAAASGLGALGTTEQAGAFGGLGAGYGGLAAGMAPQAQTYGQTAADIGMGGLGYGAMGAGAGMAAGRAGEQYARQATDPYAMQSYMNPYVEASLQPQLNMLARQGGIQGAAQQGAATQAGAFGGSRSALANSLAQQNALMAQQQAIGSGYNQAYQQAQQAQQFGANLGLQGRQAQMQGAGIGLQGLGTAMQGQQAGLAGLQQAGNLYGQGMTGAQIGLQGVGAQQAGYAGANAAAGTLGQLGQTQFGQQQAINQAQQTTGAVQQAQAQQALDQQYQDFMKQKNYPYQQLAFMSDMLRGLPLSQSAQSQYTAPPNAASQLGGLGMSALGIYGMSGGFKADGGMVGKGYAKGGQIGYSIGGDISLMNEKQLTELLGNPSLRSAERDMVEKQLMLIRRMEMNPASAEIMAPAEQQMAQRSGIGSIATGDMVPEQMAGGGIVAFASGGLKRPENEIDYTEMIKKRLAEMETGNPFAKSEQQAADIQKAMEGQTRMSPYAALANAGLATMAGTSPHALTNLGLGGIEGLKSYAKSQGDIEAGRKLLLQQQVEAEKAKYGRDTGNLNALISAQGQKDVKEIGLLNARNTAAATAGNRQNALMIQAQNSYNQALDNAKDTLLKQTKFSSLYRNDPAAFNRAAKAEALQAMSPQVLELLGMKPTADASAPPPGKTPTPAKSYPPASPAAISALKLSKDQATASKQFDDIFGPGAAAKALGK